MNNSDQDIKIKRTGDGKYMIGDKKISAKVVNGNLLVRVGGGYQTMKEYMETFGEAKLKRNARKSKREKRQSNRKSRKPRVLNYSGASEIVGGADLLRSMQ